MPYDHHMKAGNQGDCGKRNSDKKINLSWHGIAEHALCNDSLQETDTKPKHTSPKAHCNES